MSRFLNTSATTTTTTNTCFLVLVLVLVLVSAAAAHGDDDDEPTSSKPPPNLRAKSLILVKIWCLVLVFAGTFIGGMSPCFFKWNGTFLTLGTQFSGGVFLATALMHFLSDANETFVNLTTSGYPFAFMLASAGYLLTMLADCVIKALYIKRDIGQIKKTGTSSCIELEQVELEVAAKFNGNNDHPHRVASLVIRSVGDTVLLIVALCFHSVFEGIAIGVAETAGDAWKALWTISLHKIFAAVAMSIALLNMVPHRPLLSCAAYAFAFAISSPIGIAIGILIDQTAQGHVADWIFAISMGLACGVFVYVSINHLLSNNHEDKVHHKHKEQLQKGDEQDQSLSVYALYARFFAVLLGVGVIAIVMIWDT